MRLRPAAAMWAATFALSLGACNDDAPWSWEELERRAGRYEGDPATIDEAALRRSVELAATHMVEQQLPSGLFRYEYDVASGLENPESNTVRQVGGFWCLAFLLGHPQARLAPPLRARVQAAYDRMAAAFAARRRPYAPVAGAALLALDGPEAEVSTGAMALSALAIEERLAAGDRRLAPLLDELLAYLVGLQRTDGTFAEALRPRTGPARGANPYADGEAFLALAQAHHRLGDRAHAGALERAAAGLVRRWLTSPRGADRKGFYQWGTMALYEHSRSHPEARADDARAILAAADWMVLEHKTLTRARNTHYAVEGLARAYAIASERRDRRRMRGLRFAILKSHARLLQAQVGHPLAARNALLGGLPPARLPPARTLGGFLNGHEDPKLRIDVTQHALHALLLTLEHLY